MKRVLMKGCEAIAEAAVRSGCRFFAGYPITPQNEIPEYFARRMPEVGGQFLQGESEVASINMVYGAASSGVRSMTSSSSPGISLKSEGISYCAAARIPMVYVNVLRGGPGIGVIQPAQNDYFQAVKASGNGGFRMRVFAPATVQEAVDMTYAAFDYADQDNNPVLILSDGIVGSILEPVVLPPMRTDEELEDIRSRKLSWQATGHKLVEKRAWINPGCWDNNLWEQGNREADALYKSWQKDAEYQLYRMEDAEVILTAYGISARMAEAAVDSLREEGIAAGMIRAKTLYPFPYEAYEQIDYSRCKGILNIEMSIPAQFIEDVKAAVKGRAPISVYLRSGGNMLSKNEMLEAARKIAAGKDP